MIFSARTVQGRVMMLVLLLRRLIRRRRAMCSLLLTYARQRRGFVTDVLNAWKVFEKCSCSTNFVTQVEDVPKLGAPFTFLQYTAAFVPVHMKRACVAMDLRRASTDFIQCYRECKLESSKASEAPTKLIWKNRASGASRAAATALVWFSSSGKLPLRWLQRWAVSVSVMDLVETYINDCIGPREDRNKLWFAWLAARVQPGKDIGPSFSQDWVERMLSTDSSDWTDWRNSLQRPLLAERALPALPRRAPKKPTTRPNKKGVGKQDAVAAPSPPLPTAASDSAVTTTFTRTISSAKVSRGPIPPPSPRTAAVSSDRDPTQTRLNEEQPKPSMPAARASTAVPNIAFAELASSRRQQVLRVGSLEKRLRNEIKAERSTLQIQALRMETTGQSGPPASYWDSGR